MTEEIAVWKSDTKCMVLAFTFWAGNLRYMIPWLTARLIASAGANVGIPALSCSPGGRPSNAFRPKRL